MTFELPKLPAPHKDFIPYLAKHPEKSIAELTAPYNVYEAKLREGFAQYREHDSLQDVHVNAVPIFDGHEDHVRIRSRDMDDEAKNQKFIMPLKAADRKNNGAPAIVQSMKEFKQNFNLFSESSLVDMDWSNVVAAGSSVVTSLLPVPEQYNASKRTLRQYYHQKLAPSSDVDLFIWGLHEAAAVEKIKEIELRIRNSILAETTTIRTKNAITIASQYPTRHVQIVLRLYKSVSEILTGFDVDCSCFAYDGAQVYGVPRGIAAFMTQINTIDLTRRSPSYESRLSKYSRRGFEVYWPLLARQRVDPSIFERSFARTMGLARLLVLEALPMPSEREEYLIQRRAERGRPEINTWRRNRNKLTGNVKEQEPDDVAEWNYDDDIANYHTFTVPYGPKYNAKKIEKLLYTKDLLLNAEWNPKKDRTVNLHRHPCFIGDAASVLHDCCGFCPEPTTDEEREVAAEESKIYVHGDLQFMTDDPGRQAIGSFHPITNDDWTDMAYVGNTTELCQAICSHNLAFVQEWCAKDDIAIDRRDHTGRTPLQLAVQCSTPEIVQCLIDNGARIVARVIDGMTALHIAAARGSLEMVNSLLEKSEANEHEEAEKEETRKAASKNAPGQDANTGMDRGMTEDIEEDDSEDLDDTDRDEVTTMTDGSFVKVKPEVPQGETIPDGDSQGPDVYDVNVLGWDSPVSPLHLAILEGHVAVIELLVSKFGADVLLPVKILNSYTKNPQGAILTLVLAARLSDPKGVTSTLLKLGASSAQADMNQISALHYIVSQRKVDMLKTFLEEDAVAARGALGHVVVTGYNYFPETYSPLTSAIQTGDSRLVKALLDVGVKGTIEFEDWVAAYIAHETSKSSWYTARSSEQNKITFITNVQQPIIKAVEYHLPNVVQQLLDMGVDVNTIDQSNTGAYYGDEAPKTGQSLLDCVNKVIEALQPRADSSFSIPEPISLKDDHEYLSYAAKGTYQHWSISEDVRAAKELVSDWKEQREQEKQKNMKGSQEKKEKLLHLEEEFRTLRKKIFELGGKTFDELHHRSSQKGENQVSQPKEEDEKRFDPRVNFRLPDLTDCKREAYIRLFEAAWNDDEGTIKELTLGAWGGPTGENRALQIATQDWSGFSPFTIAVMRGHRHLASTILQIASVQYQPPETSEPRRRYVLDNDSDSDSDRDENDLFISSEIVDDNFTIENVAALSKAVGSKVKPLQVIGFPVQLWKLTGQTLKEYMQKQYRTNWNYIPRLKSSELAFSQLWDNRKYTGSSLISLAVTTHDLSLLRYLISCGKAVVSSESLYGLGDSVIHPANFTDTLENGHLDMAAELIQSTGAELQLENLVKQTKSGLNEVEKPKYYQGLTIRGSKNKRWAQEGAMGRNQSKRSQANPPPLLQACYQGNLASAEWFLSDTPSRLYKTFAASQEASLSLPPGNLDQAIDNWLETRRHLALHCAVISPKSSPDLVKYLIKAIPESLESKSISGHTPLSLAFSLRKVEIAETLIAAGADQTTRDVTGRNILHHALCGVDAKPLSELGNLHTLIQLIDKRILPALFLERCQEGPTALTSLAQWLLDIRSRYEGETVIEPEALESLSQFLRGDELCTMDGSGQLPLHHAVKDNADRRVKVIIEMDPSLLFYENAMGQTPLELADSLYVRYCTDGAPSLKEDRHGVNKSIADRDPATFLPDYVANPDPPVVKVWKICKEAAARASFPRKLVSVMDAAEVARRLARRKKEEPQTGHRKYGRRYDDEDEKEPGDEVDRWYCSCIGWSATQLT